MQKIFVVFLFAFSFSMFSAPPITQLPNGDYFGGGRYYDQNGLEGFYQSEAVIWNNKFHIAYWDNDFSRDWEYFFTFLNGGIFNLILVVHDQVSSIYYTSGFCDESKCFYSFDEGGVYWEEIIEFDFVNQTINKDGRRTINGNQVIWEDMLMLSHITGVCGDGSLADHYEECDDGNNISGDGCSALCIEEYCGDGIINDNDEECDDGNNISGDGCSNTCEIEAPQDATVPSSVSLLPGSINPVGNISNVSIPLAGGTDSTGSVSGWVAGNADTIRFNVIDDNSATSTITINGTNYINNTDYVIGSNSPLNIVVTTSEAGFNTVIRTFVVNVAATSNTITQNIGTAQYAQQRMGQTFKVPVDAQLNSIELTFAMRGTYMGTGQLTVYTDESRTTTVATATNTILDTSDGEFSSVTGTFLFSGENLTANTSYYFELVDIENNNAIYLWQISTNPYADGSAYGGSIGGTASLLNGTDVDCQFVITYSAI